MQMIPTPELTGNAEDGWQATIAIPPDGEPIEEFPNGILLVLWAEEEADS